VLKQPFDVFISYAPRDEKFKKQLETHLILLKREGVIRIWHNRETKVGEARGWEQEIADHIDSAQIILLLLSPSYLASDHLYYNEMIRAIKRQESDTTVRVISIIVRHFAPGDPSITPFQKIQSLPSNGKPIEGSRNPNKIWSTIIDEIRHVCEKLRASNDKK
jgi:TIR domain